MKRIFSGIFLLAILNGCSGEVDSRFVTVQDFELSRYLGTWYEIARLDHSFERGLIKITAEYSLSENGKVRVVNRDIIQRRTSGSGLKDGLSLSMVRTGAG
jgi:apolipoprotein D and lipocalin family protein